MCAVHAPRFDKWGAVGSGSTTELVGAELVSFRTRFGLDVISRVAAICGESRSFGGGRGSSIDFFVAVVAFAFFKFVRGICDAYGVYCGLILIERQQA